MAAGPGRRGPGVGLPVRRDRLAQRAGADRRPGLHDPSTHARAAHGPLARVRRRLAPAMGARADKLRTLHGEGKVSVLPCIGYASPNQSHFTSRHYWEVGETNPQGQVGWLGRYLDQHGSSTTRSRDWRSTRSSPRPWRRPATRWPRCPTRPTTASRRTVSTRRSRRRCCRSSERSAASDGRPRARQGSRGHRDDLEPARAAVRFGGHAGGGLSEQRRFGRRMASLAALLASPLPLKVVSRTGRGRL